MVSPRFHTPRTDLGEARVSSSGTFERYTPPHTYTPPTDGETRGKYGNRPIIGHTTRINGGVYLGGSAREAIVVDDSREDNSYLRDAYGFLRSEVLRGSPLRYRWRNRAPIRMALESAYFYTQQNIPYDADKVHEVTGKYPPDKKLDITKFIGGGVCRHQALLAGYFVEKMIDDGMIDGDVHVERNESERGAHAWVRYTSAQGQGWIIDPAQHFVGEVDKVNLDSWNYSLPE